MSPAPRYVAGCSFGKDSLATVLIAIEHGEPLDEAVYCEVMFNDEISGEVPEHRDFIYGVAIPKLAKMGVKTNVIRDKRTYVSSFTRVIKSGPHAGQINAFPLCGRCCIQRDCKVPPLKKWKREIGGEVVQYVGLAADEQERLMRDGVRGTVSLLDTAIFARADVCAHSSASRAALRSSSCARAVKASPLRSFTASHISLCTFSRLERICFVRSMHSLSSAHASRSEAKPRPRSRSVPVMVSVIAAPMSPMSRTLELTFSIFFFLLFEFWTPRRDIR